MKESNSEREDAKLSALLLESRAAPSLPPRFQDAVWRRIEGAGTAVRSTSSPGWLAALAAWLLRPRPALALATVLIVAGGWWGAHAGSQALRHEAQARYIAAVAPNALR